MRPLTTLLAFLVTLAPLPAAAQGLRSTRQDAELMNYRLSMEKLRKLVEVQRALAAAHAKDPKVFENIDTESQARVKENGGPLTVAQKAAIFDRHPEARRVFTNAGWNFRDWMLTSEAMGNAYVGLEIKKGRIQPEVAAPPATAAQKANVVLLEKNDAEWQKILEELDRLGDELIQ
jgi:hypothetical protein